MNYKKRCKDCAYLVADNAGKWRCDIDFKKCSKINFCDAVEKEIERG